MNDGIWIDDEADGLEDAQPVSQHDRPQRPRGRNVAHIGCPMSYLKRVFPVVGGKSGLAVALHIYRLRSVRRNRTVKVANAALLDELGISRQAKYRALRQLAKAGIITLQRYNGQAMLVTFCDETED